MKLGLLHPGAMGVTIGAAMRAAGHEVLWLTADRGPATVARAEQAELSPVEHLEDLVAASDGLISVCPPGAAVSLATAVRDSGFDGTYLDANAVAPASARSIHELMGKGFVDGGIIGPPAHRAGTTRLYLSGERAPEVVDWFAADILGVHPISGPPGAASALKMCYAAYTKGISALLLAIRALADAEGVSEPLLAEWGISQPELGPRSEGAARGTAGKAWRFVAEMEEIARTFEGQSLPGGFHEAAADVYQRMSGLKEVADADLEAVLAALLESSSR